MEDLQHVLTIGGGDGCAEGAPERLALLARGLSALAAPVAGMKPDAGVAATGAAMAEVDQLERLLRAGRAGVALQLCRDRLDGRDPARLMGFYGQVVLPLIRRLEAAWIDDRIGFDALGMTFFHLHRLLAQLSGATGPEGASGPGAILVATVPGEGHVLGAQILADLLSAAAHPVGLELETTAAGLAARVAERPLAALCLSVGHDAALDGLADLIAELRTCAADPRMRVLVGGPALIEPRGQYAFLGADAVALTVEEALALLPRAPAAGPAGRS